jgi:hypothetical protein
VASGELVTGGALCLGGTTTEECGDAGEVCCDGGCNDGCCVRGRCVAEGSMCGTVTTCTDGSCVGGMVNCGNEGQACCPPGAGSPAFCTVAGTVCQGGGFGGATQCVACGGPGEACCDGQACDGGGCCVDGLCVGEGDACGDEEDGTCSDGGCEDGACGRIGDDCCSGDIGCSAPFAVCGGDFCVACGGLDQPCCGSECGEPYFCAFAPGGRRCRLPMSGP